MIRGNLFHIYSYIETLGRNLAPYAWKHEGSDAILGSTSLSTVLDFSINYEVNVLITSCKER